MMKDLTQYKYSNILEMLMNSKNKFYNKAAIRWIQKGTKKIQTISFNELTDSMIAIFYGLNEMGFTKGDRIGIYSDSTPEWIMTDLGIQALGAVSVPIDANLKAGDVISILKDSKCKALFVDSYEKVEEITPFLTEISELKLVVVLSPKKRPTQDSHVMNFKKLLSLGEDQYHSSNRFNNSVSKIQGEDLTNVFYSSKNTEEIKGVELTHKDVLSDARLIVQIAKKHNDQIDLWEHHYLSIFPFSYAISKVMILGSLLMGATIDILNSFNIVDLTTAFKKFKPTLIGPEIHQKGRLEKYIREALSDYSSRKRERIISSILLKKNELQDLNVFKRLN